MNRKVWGIPLILALITIFGLLAALLGTGVWYILSWITLIIPIVTIVWKCGNPTVKSKS
ncbi:hypothetical protein [Mucilaginibacter lappiensis]|uniref:Uncharacterized protein n=1 Tax=Mucilaginibacter lappiensis TaxID=354630 RepID=A0A1N7FRU0_9SPHI|nr:hypothetical protein [Mucilaginibacter lappiensis]MBB6112555.1 hypothetical protein [Mucilaginibacter lappiensis]MBB6129207.1 hypothetical protein [Mucilaginibacter lappiensis]SIS03072.1 hypothetical protein SAMN05421821_11991 [Mucilaginibacter lappiensis]